MIRHEYLKDESPVYTGSPFQLREYTLYSSKFLRLESSFGSFSKHPQHLQPHASKRARDGSNNKHNLGEWLSTLSSEPLNEARALCGSVVTSCKYWLITAPSLGISILQVIMHLWYLCYAVRFAVLFWRSRAGSAACLGDFDHL